MQVSSGAPPCSLRRGAIAVAVATVLTVSVFARAGDSARPAVPTNPSAILQPVPASNPSASAPAAEPIAELPPPNVPAPVMDSPSRPCLALGNRNGVVACIGNQPITVNEMDLAGGHALHEALQQVFEQRTLALYEVISQRLLDKEATAHHLTVDELLEQKVFALVKPVGQAEVNAYLKERTGSANADPAHLKQVSLYLNFKRRADSKRTYIDSLFEPYSVRVSLEPPPPPVAEEVRGPLSPAVGAGHAPVSVIVFADYLCPYCRQLSQTLEELLKRNPKDLRVIWRQFPIHPQADRMSQAALCADEQGHFSTYHSLLFGDPHLTVESLDTLAQQAGLNSKAFSECLSSDRYASRIADDLKEGKRLGITGTPTLFVNGIRFEGNQPESVLQAQIAAALNPKNALAATRPLATP